MKHHRTHHRSPAPKTLSVMGVGVRQCMSTQLGVAASVLHRGIQHCCSAGCGPPCFVCGGRLGWLWASLSLSLCCYCGCGVVLALATPLSGELLGIVLLLYWASSRGYSVPCQCAEGFVFLLHAILFLYKMNLVSCRDSSSF
jgi:hypothetical protein